MEKLALKSLLRTWEEKMSVLRADRKIPAVVYGHKFKPVSISLDYSEFLKLFRIAGQTHIIKLSIDGKNQDVIVHALQYHPVTWDFQHIDFMAIDAKEKIHVNIPLKLIGNSPATREWGLVDQLVDEIELKCFPADLVDHFEFDISGLTEIGQVAHLSDLKLDLKKFEIHADMETPIVSILEQKWAKIEEEVVAPSAVPATQDEKKTEE
jgi:large subunit ribosomal protein L25